MRRRHLLAVGATTVAVLSMAGMSWVWIQPPRAQGRLSLNAREVMSAVARAVLDEILGGEPAAQDRALSAYLNRLEALLAGMPHHLQAEVDQLLALLAAPPGRVALLGLTTPWAQASRAQVQAALQDLRGSSLVLRQQIFHALRDLTNAAYFADDQAWSVIGYPGPRAL